VQQTVYQLQNVLQNSKQGPVQEPFKNSYYINLSSIISSIPVGYESDWTLPRSRLLLFTHICLMVGLQMTIYRL